ncbi:MAG: SEC-C metal-binding domain-containing protein [Pseudolabrys sp.]
MSSEDFILLNCENWTEENQAYYEKANAELRFFQTEALKEQRKHATDFPSAQKPTNLPNFGRNQMCPCGSGKKYKRCHGR